MKSILALLLIAILAIYTNATEVVLTKQLTLEQMKGAVEELFNVHSVDSINCEFESKSFRGIAGSKFSFIEKDKDDVDHYRYDLTMCQSSTDTACKGGSICQYDVSQGGAFTSVLGKFSATSPSYAWVDASKPEAGVIATFNDHPCGIMGNAIVTLNLSCGKSQSFSFIETAMCKYNAELSHPKLCAGGADSSGLSGGSIFLIILLSVSIAYFLIGCVICWKKYDKRGLDACPHKNFWFSLPGLVKDGCVFTWGKLRNLCGAKTITTSSGDYESA